MAGLPEHTEIFARVVVHNRCEVNPAFVILLDGFDCSDAPGQRNVKDIGAGSRP